MLGNTKMVYIPKNEYKLREMVKKYRYIIGYCDKILNDKECPEGIYRMIKPYKFALEFRLRRIEDKLKEIEEQSKNR